MLSPTFPFLMRPTSTIFFLPLKRKGLLQQIVDNEQSAFLLETSVRCPYLLGQRKLSISVPFSAPPTFRVPFSFTSSPLSESLEQASENKRAETHIF